MTMIASMASNPVAGSGRAAAPAQTTSLPPVAGQPARFDPAAVIAEVRAIIAREYVLPERRAALDAVLAKGLTAGRYDTTNPGLFAEQVNADLARIGMDKHLNFRYDPASVAMKTAQTAGLRPDPAAYEQDTRNRNHGIRQLRVLPGNVRYLDLAGFSWIGDETIAALDSAMAFLNGGDAVIIDLRRNGGGNGMAVNHLISHFVKPDTPLISFRKGDETMAMPPSRKGLITMVGKPLYVLASGGSASAAEEFVGHVAGYRLGEVVGEATAGAAFMNAIFPIAGQFEISVSIARPILAATGKDWERTGIAPTIPAPSETALDVAHVHALRQLAATSPAPRRATLEGVAEGIEAAARPQPAAAKLRAYTGSYGAHRIFLDQGRLYYQEDREPRWRMIALGNHQFTFDGGPMRRATFTMTGDKATALDLGMTGGPVASRLVRTK